MRDLNRHWVEGFRQRIILGIGISLVCCGAILSQGATLYVDGTVAGNCKGNYSVTTRDCSGLDGDAYRTIAEAARAAVAGDIVLIRAGVYNSGTSVELNDVLWPKNSGAPGKPIVFRAYNGETVVLGQGSPQYPDSDVLPLSIARCVVTMTNVSYITIEDLQFKKVAGWVFARDCHHIVFRNCVFEDGLHDAKGVARLQQCQDCSFLNCLFRNSSYDSLALEKCDRMLVEDCAFVSAVHTLLALRGSSYCVVRHCYFRNPYFVNSRAEKLVEVYDVKLDSRDPANPAYFPTPAYNSTKHNLFEYNFFGYHPFRPNSGAQTCAFEYSGQESIIRRNLFSNPPLKTPDPTYPTALAGGIGIMMRWGGSWDGWTVRTDGTGWWAGEAIEAGYVTQNRIYNNVFRGYDNGCFTIPSDYIMDKVLNPPPLYETNPTEQYTEKYAFQDNLILNNIMVPGQYLAHIKQTWQLELTGTPVAVTMMGLLDGVRFQNNDFYAIDESTNIQMYLRVIPPVGKRTELRAEASGFDVAFPETFVQNLEKNPLFVSADLNDFRLKEESPLIDAGAFATVAVGVASGSKEMEVQDPNFFYDGFGIEGEEGDLIQLKGQTETARIIRIDYEKKTLTLDGPLSWQDGQSVTLAYMGSGPDVGTFEKGQDIKIGPTTGSFDDIFVIPSTGPGPENPTLAFTRSGASAILTYTGTLESATNVSGPWTSVSGASSPYTPQSGSGITFYRTSQ